VNLPSAASDFGLDSDFGFWPSDFIPFFFASETSCVCVFILLQVTKAGSGCGSMVEYGLPKAETRVRFPSPAPLIVNGLQSGAVKVQ
jgi:hypothetical protein